MGTVEDIRIVLQDFLAPELRAITIRLDAMDQKMDLRFDAIEEKMDMRFNAVDLKFQTVRTEIAQVKELLDLDRRLARLEAK